LKNRQSVRLTKEQINNSTIQVLALANIVNKIDRRYANAFGVGYNNDMSAAAGAIMNMRNGAEVGQAMSNPGATMSNNMNMSSNNMVSMMKNDQPSSGTILPANNNSNRSSNNPKTTIVNVSDYQSANGLTNIAQQIFNNTLLLKSKSSSSSSPDKTSTAIISELQSGLAQLKSAIDAKKPYNDIMLIIHTKIQPSIMNAFDLKLV
jgi:hypothetical protein